MKKIGFIGTGNMGSAMIKGITNQFDHVINIYDINQASYSQFDQATIKGCCSIKELVEVSDYIVLTVKPNYYEEVCLEIKKHIKEEQIIVTVAPGYSISKIKEHIGHQTKVIRTMPNTPAMVGCGVTAYCYDKSELKADEVEWIVQCFECFGRSFCVSEGQMDAVVPTSGSSPAYAYMFIEAMGDAAVRFGLPREMAYEMAAYSLKGACEMVLATGEHPGRLKDAVTSPGGTTIEAVAKLEETGFRHSVISSMTACYEKTKQMSK